MLRCCSATTTGATSAARERLLSGWKDGRKQLRRDEVFDNMRWLEIPLNVSPGHHALKLIMIDPEVVIDQIVVNPDNQRYSYFGAGYQ